jgi:hypothetical protein
LNPKQLPTPKLCHEINAREQPEVDAGFGHKADVRAIRPAKLRDRKLRSQASCAATRDAAADARTLRRSRTEVHTHMLQRSMRRLVEAASLDPERTFMEWW